MKLQVKLRQGWGVRRIFCAWVVFLLVECTHMVRSTSFEAAFQGECRASNPCQQLCFDLHDGTFECACHERFHLDANGYACHGSLANFRSLETPKLADQASSATMLKPERVPVATNRSSDVLYSCSDIECEAGGVCLDADHSLDDRVRCHCPLGRGGHFCEKVVEVRHPHFQGTSYLALPTLRTSYRSMRLAMEFKPERFDGLLLYSGQETTLEGDFIALTINQGFLEFRFDCGMGEGLIRSDVPVLLNAWNTVAIYRDGRNAWLQLNSGQQIYGHSRGLFSRITFRLETFLGGSPNITQIERRLATAAGFSGCIRTLEINGHDYNFEADTIDGVDIEQCNTDACDGVVCLNEGHCAVNDAHDRFCICPLGHTGEFCETETRFLIPTFNGSSHLQFLGLGTGGGLYTELHLKIKPATADGLFLYNGARMDGGGDFLSLNLVDGYVEFRFDLGSGAAIIRSPEKLSLNVWHSIFASRTGREGVLKVDNQPIALGLSLGGFTQLALPLNLYLGGVPRLLDLHRNVQASQMFTGCIQQVSINGRRVSFEEDVLAGAHVGSCHHACNAQPCHNNGACEPLAENFRCHCQAGYIGAHCERGTPGLSIVHPMFYGNSFLQYTESDIISRMAGVRTRILLQLRAFSSNGLILWFGETASGRSAGHISLGVENGHLTIGVALGGGGGERLVVNGTRLDDGRWHDLELDRTGRGLIVTIDGRRVMARRLRVGDKTRLDVRGSLYLGGMEDTVLETNALYESGFIGCISNVTLGVDGRYNLHLLEQAERAINIRSCI